MEIEASKRPGWSISAIARHTGRDRKTVRAHLNGERKAGPRRRPDGEDDPFDRFEPYGRQRFMDDRHVWAAVPFDEVTALGYERAYLTFTRQLRNRAAVETRLDAMAATRGDDSRHGWLGRSARRTHAIITTENAPLRAALPAKSVGFESAVSSS